LPLSGISPEEEIIIIDLEDYPPFRGAGGQGGKKTRGQDG